MCKKFSRDRDVKGFIFGQGFPTARYDIMWETYIVMDVFPGDCHHIGHISSWIVT